MKKTTLALSLVLTSAFATGCIGEDSSLTIDNASSVALFDLAVAGSNDIDFGPNLLGNRPLEPDEQITVLLDCDTYDVLVEDEFGVQCQLGLIDLCFDDALWVIDNPTLNACAFGFSAELPDDAPKATEHAERTVDIRTEI